MLTPAQGPSKLWKVIKLRSLLPKRPLAYGTLSDLKFIEIVEAAFNYAGTSRIRYADFLRDLQEYDRRSITVLII